jgi:hypothetical protein
VFQEAFDNVHDSNMSKIMISDNYKAINKEREELSKKYKEDIYAVKEGNKIYFTKTSDDKVVKPSTYINADIRGILEKARRVSSVQNSLFDKTN